MAMPQWKGDRQYAITPAMVRKGGGAKACRRAALSPLVRARRKGAAKPPKRSLADEYQQLIAMWRQRVLLLMSRWGVLKNPIRRSREYTAQCMRNCPPAGVDLARQVDKPAPRKANSCNRPRICPHCYARRVVMDVYKALEFFFYHNYRRTPRPDRCIVAIRRRTVVTNLSVQKLLAQAQAERHADLKRISSAKGACILLTLEPGPGKSLVVRRSTIAVVPQAVDLRPLARELAKTGPCDLRAERDITKDLISRVVAWACRYPAGMMKGDASIAAEILNATANKKMATTLGELRNRQTRKPRLAEDEFS